MTAQDYLNIASISSGIFFTCFALFVSWKTHKRENTIINENFVYQKKYEACEKMFSLGVEYLTAAENVRACLSSMLKKKTEYIEHELDKRQEEFEKIEEEFELEFMKVIMILPENVINAFSDLIYKMNPWESIEDLEAWKKNINFYYKQLDEIHILVMKDLHLKELNDGIFARLNKEKKNRIPTA